MKNFILLALFGLMTFTAGAQSRQFNNPSNTDGRTDTVINAGGMVLKAQTNGAVGPLAIQLIATKVSGTVSGTAYLEASLDPREITYVTIDSLVLSNVATNTALKSYPTNAYNRYQWRIVSSGTQAVIVRAYAR